MKFAVLNDIHYGVAKPHKGVIKTMSHLSEDLLDKSLSYLTSDKDVMFIADLGDIVTDANSETDFANVTKVLEKFSKLKIPTYHIPGNHEQRTLSDHDLQKLFGYEKLYFSKELDEYKFIFLYTKETNIKDKVNSEIEISQEQEKWLENELKVSNKKVIIFSHHSLADQDTKNNFYFSGKEHRCLVRNRQKIRSLIDESGKVIACINAHLHWNNLTIHNNIPYITLQSLVEDFNTNGIPSASHTIFELNNNFLKCHVFGNDRMEFLKYL
ncbi:MAG: metallophosphoesterase [Patescibacteria group bacterium]